jgi:hypothetical protein
MVKTLLLIPMVILAIFLKLKFEHDEEIETLPVNSTFTDPRSYETQIESERFPPGTPRRTYTLTARIASAARSGPIPDGIAPCEPLPPGEWKEGGATVGALTLIVGAIELAPRHVREIAHPIAHVVGERIGTKFAREFPAQRVATCMRLPSIDPMLWRDFQPVEVTAEVRRLGGSWHRCNPRATNECGISYVMWANVPSVESLAHDLELAREIVRDHPQLAASLFSSLADPLGLFSPWLANWSDEELEGRLVIVLARLPSGQS